MKPRTISIDLPEDILDILNEPEEALQNRIKLSLAIELYVEEKVTLGKAAQIAEVSKTTFESLLSKSRIPISNLTFSDIQKDLEKLKSL